MADVEISETLSRNMIDNDNYMCYNVNELNAGTNDSENKDSVNVVFIIDTRESQEQLENVKREVLDISRTVKEEGIEMSDFIVCPNCGKKINIRTISVLNTPFLKYITCSNCGKFLTKPQRSTFIFIKLFKINILFISILGVFLTLISIYNNTNYVDHNAQYTVFQGACLTVLLILVISLFLIIAINDIIANKNIKTSRNGFLPVISGICMNRYITYLKEELITQNEIDVIKKRVRMFEHRGRNSDMDKCIILLPRTDITVKIGIESVKKIELINLFDIYKFNGEEIFLLLSDYQIDHDIKLEFKNLSKINLITILGDSFELFDLNNEYIGTAVVIQV